MKETIEMMQIQIQRILSTILISIIVSSCSSKQESYDPNSYLSENEQKKLMLKIVPYFAKVPKGFDNPVQRFNTVLDTFYIKEIEKYSFQHYFIKEDSFHYFMVNRPAPSLYEKKVSIAGKFKIDQAGRISEYEEIFWTFKMKIPELQQKGPILFSEMVKGGDLSEYMPGKNNQEWIEFPDNKCSYNKKEQKWIFASNAF